MSNDTTTSVGDSIQVATLKALQGLTEAIGNINDRLDRLEAPTATFQVAEPPKAAPKGRRSAPKGAKPSGLDRFTPEMAKAIRNRRRPNASELAAAALQGSRTGSEAYGLRFNRGKFVPVSPDTVSDGDILVSTHEVSGKGQPRYRLA